MLLPPAKAVRLLGVASRMIIFIVCLTDQAKVKSRDTCDKLARTHLAGVSFIRFSGVNAKLLVCTTVRVGLAAGAAAATAAGAETGAAAAPSAEEENKLVVKLTMLEKIEVSSGTYPTEPCSEASTSGALFSCPALLPPAPLDLLRFELPGLCASMAVLNLDLPLSSGQQGSMFAASELRRRVCECKLTSTSAALRLRSALGAEAGAVIG